MGEAGSGATVERVVRRRSVYADRLLPFGEFTFSDGAEFARRGAWREFFGARIGPAFNGRLTFEIGCNDASLLASVAARHPATAFVGIDWKCRALHAAATRVDAAGLRNVSLLHGRGQDVARFFAEAELDEVWVFHPEPCDHAREWRNRLVTEPFLHDVARVLRGGGEFVLKTDHAEYHASAVAASRQVVPGFSLLASSGDFWNDRELAPLVAAKCFAGEQSPYERRYVKKRRPIHYLALRRAEAASAAAGDGKACDASGCGLPASS